MEEEQIEAIMTHPVSYAHCSFFLHVLFESDDEVGSVIAESVGGLYWK